MLKTKKKTVIMGVGLSAALTLGVLAISNDVPAISYHMTAYADEQGNNTLGVPNSKEYKTEFYVKPTEDKYKGSMTFRPTESNELLIDGFKNNNNLQIAITINRADPNVAYVYELSPDNSVRKKYTLTKGATVNSQSFPGHRYRYAGEDFSNLLLERYDTSKPIWKLGRTLLTDSPNTFSKVVVPIPTKINQTTDYIVENTGTFDSETGEIKNANKLLDSINQVGYQDDAYGTGAPKTIKRNGAVYHLIEDATVNSSGKMSAYVKGWTETYFYGNYSIRYTQIDEIGNQKIELLRPNKTTEQTITIAPGEKHTFPNKGTAGGPVTVTNSYNGEDQPSYQVVYQYVQTKAASRPVDKNDNEIKHQGIVFPHFNGKPGDKILIYPEDLPNVPGYNKPKTKFEATIPADDKPIDIPYVQYVPFIPGDNQSVEIDIRDGKSNNRDYEWYIDHSKVNAQPLICSVIMAERWYNKDSKNTVEDAQNWFKGTWDSSTVQMYMMTNQIPIHHLRNPHINHIKQQIDNGKIIITYSETDQLFYNPTPESTWGRFYEETGRNNIVIKGYKYINDRLYFEVYDTNSAGMTYKNGQPKGKDRLYDAQELDNAMLKGEPIMQIIG